MLALKKELFEQLKISYPLSADKRPVDGKPTLRMKITKVSVKGLVTVKFGQEIYQYSNLGSRFIEIK